MRPRAGVILWDFDGTLAHRPGMWSRTLTKVILEHEPTCGMTVDDVRPFLTTGFPWHTPNIPHLDLQTADEWWKAIEEVLGSACIGVGFSQETARLLSSRFREAYLDPAGWIVYDDVRPVLAHLSERCWRHIILSNHVPELPDLVEAIGLSPLIENVITSARVGYEKPHPEAFRIALEVAGHPDSVWMVGDNYEADIAGAKSVGMKGILVRRSDGRAALSSEDLWGVAKILDGFVNDNARFM